MFHTVGLDRHQWRNPNISEPIQTFYEKMAALHQRGYQTSFFKDHRPNARKERPEAILTFDDGYLDNWVHVFPVLREFGLKATIFVTPQLADPRDVVRPQVPPASARDDDHDPEHCCAGFLSWSELREMERSGLVDVQSHSLTHTWYFKGPGIVDFWHPGAATERMGPVWMLWNRYPEFKPYYLTRAAEYESRIPYGTPVYEHDKSLATHRYFPDEQLDEVLAEFVEGHGGGAFFELPDWREQLHGVADEHRRRTSRRPDAGRFESHAEYRERVRFELGESKRILETELDKTIEAICWPGGGITGEVVRIAWEVGYKRFTLPTAWANTSTAEHPGEFIPRVGSVIRLRFLGRDFGPATARDFVWRMKCNEGSRLYRFLERCVTLYRWLRHELARR
jgi:peptidoglycan/xylan/chitin deacetylase (PgdA/CDA1 family)